MNPRKLRGNIVEDIVQAQAATGYPTSALFSIDTFEIIHTW